LFHWRHQMCSLFARCLTGNIKCVSLFAHHFTGDIKCVSMFGCC
jgi:hypothetical protein